MYCLLHPRAHRVGEMAQNCLLSYPLDCADHVRDPRVLDDGRDGSLDNCLQVVFHSADSQRMREDLLGIGYDYCLDYRHYSGVERMETRSGNNLHPTACSHSKEGLNAMGEYLSVIQPIVVKEDQRVARTVVELAVQRTSFAGTPIAQIDGHSGPTSEAAYHRENPAASAASGAVDFQQLVGDNVGDSTALEENNPQAQCLPSACPCCSCPYHSSYPTVDAGNRRPVVAAEVVAGATGAARTEMARRFLGPAVRLHPRKAASWSEVAAACCPYRSTSASPVRRRGPSRARTVREKETRRSRYFMVLGYVIFGLLSHRSPKPVRPSVEPVELQH